VFDADDPNNYMIINYSEFIFLGNYLGEGFKRFVLENKVYNKLRYEDTGVFYGSSLVTTANISWLDCEVAVPYLGYYLLFMTDLSYRGIYLLISQSDLSFVGSWSTDFDCPFCKDFAKLIVNLKELDFL